MRLTKKEVLILSIALQHVRAAWDELEKLGPQLFARDDPTGGRSAQLALAEIRRRLDDRING